MIEINNYTPYENASQVYDDYRKHGGMVKDWLGYYTVTTIDELHNKIGIASHHPETFSFKDVLKRFTWADGTPCGVRISSAMESIRIPSLDGMYDDVVALVEGRQGDDGFVCTDPFDPATRTYSDSIHAICFDDDTRRGVEEMVMGLRVRNGDLQVVTHSQRGPFHVSLSAEEYAEDESWYSVRNSDRIYFIPTIFSIAESVTQYTEQPCAN